MHNNNFSYRTLIACFCCLATPVVLAQSANIITEEDLHPFCTSQYVRTNYNASVEQCIDQSMICVRQANLQQGSTKITDEIYRCVFNRLSAS